MARAGILIVGNEILSGKVTDTNSPYLCRELRLLGVDVERILTIPDEVQVIARDGRRGIYPAESRQANNLSRELP